MGVSTDKATVRDTAPRKKIREAIRSCDTCRSRKGDGATQPDRICTLCVEAAVQCTYLRGSVGRIEPPKAYVAALETRLKRAETWLQQLLPGVDLDTRLDQLDDNDLVQPIGILEALSKPLTFSLDWPHTAPGIGDQDLDDSDDEHGIFAPLAEPPKVDILQKSFMGKSSDLTLISKALDASIGAGQVEDILSTACWVRQPFWTVPRHEGRDEVASLTGPFNATLPPTDLLITLIESYFSNCNIYILLLHKGLFLEQLMSGLHKVDRHFHALVLLVCALGSRWVHDMRVRTDPEISRSAGWAYFEAAEPMLRVKLWNHGRLFDLQAKLLAVFFLWGSSTPSAGWITLGVAISMVLEVGAHRKKLYRDRPTLVDQLWKRGFWLAYWADRDMSASLGRPCMIPEESFDVDLPLDVDDDCWALHDAANDFPLKHPQPSGRPSLMSYGLANAKLVPITSFAMRTLYSIKHQKAKMGPARQNWERQMLTTLDAQLTSWRTTAIPQHLHWDPDGENPVFFRQSVILWTGYHLLRIFLHCQFIEIPSQARATPAPPNLGSKLAARHKNSNRRTVRRTAKRGSNAVPSDFSLSPGDELSQPILSRDICADAARQNLQIIAAYMRRIPPPHDLIVDHISHTAYMSAVILLLVAWTADPDEAATDMQEQLTRQVNQSLAILKQCERFWQPAGKYRDVLSELVDSGLESVIPEGQPTVVEPRGSPKQYRLLRSLIPHHKYEVDEETGPTVINPLDPRLPSHISELSNPSTLNNPTPLQTFGISGEGPVEANFHGLDDVQAGVAAGEEISLDAQLAALTALNPYDTPIVESEPSSLFSSWLGISPYGQDDLLLSISQDQPQVDSDLFGQLRGEWTMF
ncbi:fungal-specific transcription factor domain-containing protein [Auriculariales sp. MPI-PUGE-AT-0066]|nr:fungal-specific transcription factor domain-containing protein [Auriculariales sp. MPI-PUGE-AT-0066]